MPRRPTVEPSRSDLSKNRPWKVEIPARIALDGKRQRFFFETKQEASNFSDLQRIRLENFGVQGSAILPPSEQEQAANAIAALKPYKVSLNEVVQDWITRQRAASASIPFETAMDAFKEWGKRSPSYTGSIRQTRKRLESLHGKLLNTITPADLTQAMDGMPGSVRNFTIRILGGLFNFGIKRGHCAENPCKKLDMAPREAVEIDIYTPGEVASIFSKAEEHDPKLVPFLAISFFCGIRRAEAMRLDWSAIDLHEGFVKLPAAITKTRQRRHIEISQNCSAWLAPHLKEVGRVTPFSPDILRTRLVALKDIHQVRTIKHGARHCFASYWLAQHGDINQVCRYLGHDDPETTFKHYAKAATKRDAEKFWVIVPKVVPKNVVSISAGQG